MTTERRELTDFEEFESTVGIFGGGKIAVRGKGKVRLNTNVDGNAYLLTISDVWLAEGRGGENVLAVSKLAKNIEFRNNTYFIVWNGKTVAIAPCRNSLYYIKTENLERILLVKREHNTKLIIMHERLGHVGRKALRDLKIDVKDWETCEDCIKGKLAKKPFQRSQSLTRSALDLVHSDVCGPITPMSYGGSRYFVSFIDDFTHRVTVYVISHKSEVFSKFATYLEWAERSTSKKLKILRSDNGGEYLSKDFQEYLRVRGIQHQKTSPYTPEQNGVAERMNRTLIEMARTMLLSRRVSQVLWADAILAACHVRNRIPTSANGGYIPVLVWIQGEKTSNSKNELEDVVSHLRTFGCLAYLKETSQLSKFSDRTMAGVMVGYSHEDGTKAYRILDPKSMTIRTSRNVQFIEDKNVQEVAEISVKPMMSMFYPQEENPIPWFEPEMQFGESDQSLVPRTSESAHLAGSSDETDTEEEEQEGEEVKEQEEGAVTVDLVDGDEDGQHDEVSGGNSAGPTDESSSVDARLHLDQAQETETATTGQTEPNTSQSTSKSTRDRRAPTWLQGYVRNVHQEERNSQDKLVLPKNWQSAMKSENSEEWRKAWKREYESLVSNNVFETVNRPTDKNVVGSKLVFSHKRNPSGKVERFKVRLVAQGFSQTYLADYEETFAPVVRLPSLRTILALAASKGWKIEQMDVETAYLNGDLDEEIFMRIPEALAKESEDKVWKLKKSLYGLKQAGRQWNIKFNQTLTKLGLKRLESDHCVYVAEDLILAIYVDDVLITSSDLRRITDMKRALERSFRMKDLGELTFIVGIHVDRVGNDIVIHQRRQIEDLLNKYGLEAAKGTRLPMQKSPRITKDGLINEEGKVVNTTGDEVETKAYQSLVGSLMYLAQGTRPDLGFAVGFLGRYASEPKEIHLRLAKGVLRYLKSSVIGIRYTYRAAFPILEGFADSDFAGSLDDRKSTTGYVFKLGSGSVSWKSRKQPTVALSTTEAEYMAYSDACSEALWFRNFLNELKGQQRMIKINADNQGAIALVKNPVYHQRSKHIDTRFHSIREHHANGNIELTYLQSNQMIADIMTKPLSTLQHETLIKRLGMVKIEVP